MDITESMPECSLLDLCLEGAVLSIGLDRTEVHNALDPELIGQLIDVLDWSSTHCAGVLGALEDDAGNPLPRVLVLSGKGKHFCAGADIGWMRDSGAQSAEQNEADARRLDSLFNSLFSHPCFTIALVSGVALGGGAGLIACSDHAIASEGAKIAMSEVKLGILPAVIGPYVRRRLGSACFRRLAMLGSRIGTEEALRIGFIDQVVASPDELASAAAVVAAEVFTSAPRAISLAKRLALSIEEWRGGDVDLREHTITLTSRMRGGAEGQEGLSSFIEGRKPDWVAEDEE